jgi:hypothetical protein
MAGIRRVMVSLPRIPQIIDGVKYREPNPDAEREQARRNRCRLSTDAMMRLAVSGQISVSLP